MSDPSKHKTNGPLLARQRQNQRATSGQTTAKWETSANIIGPSAAHTYFAHRAFNGPMTDNDHLPM